MQRRKGTDGSLLASLPWTLAALTTALLPHLPFLPPWVTAVFLACAVSRLVIERQRWRLPGPLLRMTMAVSSFLGVQLAYGTISGVGPGSALLTVMAALKLLETHRRRDQYVLLFLSIFLVMASLLREQYVWSLPYMLLAVAMTMTAWLKMSVAADGARLAFATSARLIALATPLMLVMWVLFPRLATPLWSVPIDTSGATTGINDEMSPGDLSALTKNDAVAFQVWFDGEPPPPEARYWRGLVLSRFDGRKWSGSTLLASDTRSVDYIGDPVSYRIALRPTNQQWLFALDVPRTWSLESTHIGRQQSLWSVYPIDRLVHYDVTSYTDFRLEVDAAWRRSGWYLDYPEDANPRTAALAETLRAQSADDWAYINAVLAMFTEEEFFYTLDPPRLGADPVDEFLFDTRRGFCEHYASAFGLLMRAAGIPTRIVVGYQGASQNPMGDHFVVRQSDAHAWTEVWLDGEGWKRVDPTAYVAPDRIERGMMEARFSDIGLSWGLTTPTNLMLRLELVRDLVNAKWTEFVLAYGPEQQQNFLQWLGMERPTVRRMLLTMIFVIAALLGAIALYLAWRQRPPPRDTASRLYDRFRKRAALPFSPGEAPLAYAERLAASRPEDAPVARRVTKIYLEARYGSGGPEVIAELRQAVDDYRREAAA